MKLEIQKSDLLNLIGKTQNIVEKRNSMPILINILLVAEQQKLKVLATDLEICLTDEVEANIHLPGKVAISAKSLFEIAKELSEGPIQLLKKENNWLEIRQGKFLSKIVGISDENYPVFPSYMGTNLVKIEAKKLQEMIDKVIFCVSSDEAKYYVNGAYFELSPQSGFKMVATDGHRLSMITMPDGLSQITVDQSAIIPRKGLYEIKKIIDGMDGIVELSVAGPTMIVKFKSTVLLIRLIEARFPAYQQFIPQKLSQNVVISKEDLLTSIKRVALLANQKSKAVLLSISDGKLEISSHNPDLGDASEEIEISYKGKDFKIAYNAKYVQEVLSNIQEEEVDLGVLDSLSPSLMRPHNDMSYTCIVMPMRI